jgi:geranylgeranyl diphosphate synthase type II
LKNYIHTIEEAIKHYEFPKNPRGLYDPLNYFMSIGGKRIRPAMLLASYSLFKEDVDTAIPAAIGVELFHNFTLIHDDIMDAAPTRRGMVTVHEKWDSNTGILSGDALMIKAYQEFVRCGNISLLDRFNTTALEVCEGQQHDMDFEDREGVAIDEYMEMIRLKTAVLLGFSLEAGAILSEASLEDQKALFSFGEKLGLAFQLQDDYLDAFGETGQTGKQKGGDILADKKTWLAIQCKASAPHEFKRINQLTGSNKVMEMCQLLEKQGLKTELKALVSGYSDEARDLLDNLAVNGSKEALYDLITLLESRQN